MLRVTPLLNGQVGNQNVVLLTQIPALLQLSIIQNEYSIETMPFSA